MIHDLEKIISGCQKNLRSAQEKFYKHFYPYAMSICMPYSQSTFEAEEVANDGFMKAFKKIDSYNHTYPIQAWLRKIMINTAIDNFRSNKKHYNSLEISEANAAVDTNINILEQMAAEDVIKHIQALTPAYRTVFTLATMEGYKHHEIAKKLNISEGTSKSNLAKAKARLRESIMSSQMLKNQG